MAAALEPANEEDSPQAVGPGGPFCPRRRPAAIPVRAACRPGRTAPRCGRDRAAARARAARDRAARLTTEPVRSSVPRRHAAPGGGILGGGAGKGGEGLHRAVGRAQGWWESEGWGCGRRGGRKWVQASGAVWH